MGQIFDSLSRDAAVGERFATKGRLVSFSGEAFFYTGWLKEDGSTRVRVITAENVALYDGVALTPIEAADFELDAHAVVLVVAKGPSQVSFDTRLALEFVAEDGRTTWSFLGEYDAFQIDLLADFNRDGLVDDVQPDPGWTWGAGGLGAVLLVNSDRDTAYPSVEYRDRLDNRINGPLDQEDMASLVLAISGPPGRELADCTVRLHVSDAAASRLRAFDISRTPPEVAIGPGMPTAVLPAIQGKRVFALEGLDYPDAGFTGLITISADIESAGERLGGTVVVFRVAPWLAIPNTQPVERLFIADLEDGSNVNAIRDMKTFAAAAGVRLELIPPELNRRDRWLQDEIEIGFAASTTKTLPVVLDSPRNRELDRFPEQYLLGPDFAYVTRGNDLQADSLDSFGNLDCTPPHTGPRGNFPFGRIVFGGAQPGGTTGRRMMKVVRDFVTAQIVQAPIELYSDWLNVGHVDEFMSFVPAPGGPGFRLVLASPKLARSLIERLVGAGGGDLWLMEEKTLRVRAAHVLADETLKKVNAGCQEAIDWNKNVLIREMGLRSADIVEVPALYRLKSRGRVGAFYPNAVNMQVANGHVAVPKPFGPWDAGACIFETAIKSVFDPLGLTTHFIDTYDGYFSAQGEIHCGTNVVRQPFAQAKWWEFHPAPPPGTTSRLVA